MNILFKRDLFYSYLRERGWERENINVREKYRLVAPHMHPDWGLNPQPRHVP